MRKTVVIDCFPESVEKYRRGHAIVAIDVFRATTTAVTSVALGRRCFPVPSLDAAVPLAARLDNPLLVGELGGSMPYGFDLNNSPADLEYRSDTYRPMILLSTSGTRVICSATEAQAMYVACLRNMSALARYLDGRHPTIALIGAGSRGEFRDEDQYCCALIAEKLTTMGYVPEDERTAEIIELWRGAPVEAITVGASANYLRNSGQERDLDYVVSHVDDLDEVYRFERNQIIKLPVHALVEAALD